ncbi:hypothetical protein FVE85_6092 [Porphyridium purpureum]|uniref:AB hydrolase-1 domain-containing protein n=1 Tax=Porphyridium purpureum TaxID=35688 RepID=A0A5J4Z752_PORPP|nr:hypothetical protein FVE85_6092 [Porphyridium purpureum]|eukprot:POR5202..scf295_1
MAQRSNVSSDAAPDTSSSLSYVRTEQRPRDSEFARYFPNLYHACELGEEVRLPDSRTIGYAEYCDANARKEGLPVCVFFPGVPGSRLFTHPLHARLRKNGNERALNEFIPGMRVIVVERPGFGRSSPHPERETIAAFIDDVVYLLQHLNVKLFAVLGFSAGGPYALACAARLFRVDPADVAASCQLRCIKCVVVSCVAPLQCAKFTDGMGITNKIATFLLRHVPLLAWLVLYLLSRSALADPPGSVLGTASYYCEVDRTVLRDPGVAQLFIESVCEAFARPAQRNNFCHLQ